MDDLISRQAAIELIERMKPYHQDADDIAEMIANMPPAQPGWIPCNRELPKESGYYLVTIKYGEKQYAVDCLEYNAYGKEWNDGELFGWIVTAWQPAPKPWEGGQNG